MTLPTSDTIATRQNDPWAIKLLAAQRQLYSEAKFWRRFRAWSVTATAIAGVIATILFPSLLNIIGPVGGALGIAQWSVVILEKQRTKAAAGIQEQFDTFVFPINWNSMIVKADPEDVVAADSRFKGDRAKLSNWYHIPDDLPRPFNVLLCQRSNLRWDAALRRTYANTILALMVALFVATVLAALFRGLSLGEFLLAILPSLAAFLLGGEMARAHYEHGGAQTELKRIVESAWARARSNATSVNDQEIRAIQDGIYQQRAAAPPVPDGFYWQKRDDFEREMQSAVARMSDEARDAIRNQP